MDDKLKRVIDRIQGLLAMAEDVSSPNEALIAAQQARKMMDKYQLSKKDIEKELGHQFLESQAERTTKVRVQWMMNLWAAAASLNDCVAAVTHAPEVRYLFRGFKSDAIVAKLTMDYLVATCEYACKQQDLVGRSQKHYFRLGFSEQIERRAYVIEHQRKRDFVSSTGTALVMMKEQLIETHFGLISPMKSRDSRPPDSDEMAAYQAGIERGRKVGLDRQIKGEETLKLGAQNE
jgi:hypothetical protein